MALEAEPRGTVAVIPQGLLSRLQLALMRLAARTGHIRRATLVLGRLFPRSTSATVMLAGGNDFDISLNDPYWCRIVVGWEYEPEVGTCLDQALAALRDALLLDCGANIGYWAALYAPRMPVVAVEALPHIYQRLARNADRMGFTALHRAVWDESGHRLSINWRAGGEAGASIVYPAGKSRDEVLTVSIDDLVSKYANADQPVIVKLDVEGAEVAAIHGARRSWERILWIYEDHGSDRTHLVTQTLLGLGFVVEYQEGPVREGIRDAAQLDVIKSDWAHGYNFVAYQRHGPWWESRQTLFAS